MIAQYKKIEPHELLSNWLHHLAVINGMDDRTFAKYLFGKFFYYPQKGLAFNYERYLPEVCRRIGETKSPTLSCLLREHMTITESFPFSSMTRQAELIGQFLIPPSSADFFIFPHGHGPFKPKVCPICARKDMESLGRIVLYTEHQLNGIMSCHKHHVNLIQTCGYPTVEDITDPEPADEETVLADRFEVELFHNGWHLSSLDLRNALERYATDINTVDIYSLIDSYEDREGDRKALRHWLSSGVDIWAPRKIICFLSRIFGQYEKLAMYLPEFSPEVRSYENVVDYQIISDDGFLVTAKCMRCGRIIHAALPMLNEDFGCSCRHAGMTEEDIVENIIQRQITGYSLDRYTGRHSVSVRHNQCGSIRKMDLSAVIGGKFFCHCEESGESRIGERNRNVLGFLMTIVRYGGSKDLDVQFENGTVVHHRTYSEFRSGHIRLPFCFSEKYIGMQNVNQDNNAMTIAGYYGYEHCIVLFSDGSKAACSVDQFQKGTVKKPNAKVMKDGSLHYPLASLRLQQTNTTDEGITVTLINYRNAKDIDVALETGEIIPHLTYKDFQDGSVYSRKKNTEKHYLVGRTAVSVCGQVMRIIKYRSSKDIDVEFDDGTLLRHVSYRAFCNGSLNPSQTKNIRMAERIGMKIRSVLSGQMMEIIEYHSVDNITVRFETGETYYRKSYSSFIRGKIGNPEYVKRTRLYETKINTQNEKMTIIRYGSSGDIDVQFEDGTIVAHRQYSSFVSGRLRNPNSHTQKFNSRIGETGIATNGLKMKIIAYRSSEDIDVEFEDGVIVTHKTVSCFKKGNIKHPSVKTLYKKYPVRSERLGEEGTACNGMRMKIVRYASCNDIDILMEDGILLKNREYKQFKNGNIGIKEYNRIRHIGETNLSTSGETMTITEFISTKNITVRFDDGTVVKQRHYSAFLKGYIRNPNNVS